MSAVSQTVTQASNQRCTLHCHVTMHAVSDGLPSCTSFLKRARDDFICDSAAEMHHITHYHTTLQQTPVVVCVTHSAHWTAQH